MSAGCAGWGTDNPANETPKEETDGNDEAQDGVDPSDDDTDGSVGDNGSTGDEDGGDDAVDDNPPETDATSSEDNTDETVSTSESDETDTNTGTDTGDESDTTDATTGSEDTDTDDSEPAGEDNSEEASGDSNSTDEDGSSDDESNRGGSDDTNNGDENRESGADNTSNNESNTTEEIYTLTVVTQSDVPVTLERVADGATTERTATDGTVEFEVLEGYYGLFADGHTAIDPELSVEVTEDTTIEIQSTAGETISVTVIDAETGDPVEDATIEGVCTGIIPQVTSI